MTSFIIFFWIEPLKRKSTQLPRSKFYKQPVLEQWCSNYSPHQNHLAGLLKHKNLTPRVLFKPSMGLHRVGHDWSDLAAAAAAVRETWVPSLGWEDPLEKGIVTHYSVLAWRIPWTEEPGGLWVTPGFWPGKFHGLWGRKELDTTEPLSTLVMPQFGDLFIKTHCYLTDITS